MSEYDDLIESHEEPREGEGIQYVDEQGVPEPQSKDAHLEGKVESLPPPPPLMTASDLLPPEDDPLSSLPHEPPDEDTPPDEATPPFIVMPVAGRTMPSIYTAEGIAVGLWIHENYYDLDGAAITQLLLSMGMEAQYAEWYGKTRDARIEADRQLAGNPVVQAFAEEEDRRRTDKQQIQDAFVKAQKGKKT